MSGQRASEHEPGFVSDPVEEMVAGWTDLWRKAKPKDTASLLTEATRMKQRPECLAGMIRASKDGDGRQ